MDAVYIILCFLHFVSFTNSQTGKPVVTTLYGQLQGITTTTEDSKSLTRFLAVPYAKPPINELRFMKPEKPDKWEGILDATRYGNECISALIPPGVRYAALSGRNDNPKSEDCLALDIYYPGDFTSRMIDMKAVLVFIHGGGYTVGSAIHYDGSILSTNQDVIVVIINYRLGFLGFASSHDGRIQGNQALFDQNAALIWIQDNIETFGGDKSRVTIFGESAGADSVVLHLVSPLSKSLFSRAIVESTAHIVRPTRKKHSLQTTKIAQSFLSCDENDSQKMLCCLQNVPVDKFTNLDYYSNVTLETTFIDGEFLVDDPVKLFETGQFHKSVEVIFGFNGDDGNILLQYFIPQPYVESVTNGVQPEIAQATIKSLIPKYFFPSLSGDSVNAEIIMDIIYREYFRGSNTPLEITRNLLNLFTTHLFKAVTLAYVDGMADNGGKVYLYEFVYTAEKLYPELVEAKLQLQAGHGEEMVYVFGNGTIGTKEDKVISLSLMHAWGEFAKTGKAKYLTENLESVEWRPYMLTSKDYFVIDAPLTRESVKQVPEIYHSDARLWQYVLPQIAKLKTECPNLSSEEKLSHEEL